MKKFSLLFSFVAALSLSLASVAFAQDGDRTFTADLEPLNDPEASGTATMTLNGNDLTVDIESQGLAPGLFHAQHIHGEPGVLQSTCPGPEADQDGDGLISTPEGDPFYGGIVASLTTEGDTSPDSGFAGDRFPIAGSSDQADRDQLDSGSPIADHNGDLSYSRTFTVSDDVAANLGDFAIVQHGVDLNGSGEYDFESGVSPADPELPFQATIPANCGTVEEATATDVVMPDTGGTSLLIPAAALLLGSGALGLLVLRRIYGAGREQ